MNYFCSEKNKLEQEANQQEGVLKLKSSEIKSLQNEAETLQQMIKQLEAQKVEARKRLDDMATQVDRLWDVDCDLVERERTVTRVLCWSKYLWENARRCIDLHWLM